MRKYISIISASAAIILSVLLLSGCGGREDADSPRQSGFLNKSREDSKLPWARPADWEYDMPGLGPSISY
jgi:hypothetical protein